MTPPPAARRPTVRRLAKLSGAVAGIALLAWLVATIGPGVIAAQLYSLGTLLPVILALTGVRHLLQATGWRLAIPVAARPGWSPLVRGTIAGEAVGYLAWAGPIARDPIKTIFVRAELPVGVALTAAIAERVIYAIATLLLMALAAALVLSRLRWVVLAATAIPVVTATLWPHRCAEALGGRPDEEPATPAADPLATKPVRSLRRFLRAIRMTTGDLWCRRRPTLLAILLIGLAQVALTVTEVFLILWWLGATPTLADLVLFEAGTKLVNGVGMFVPGRIGIAEATSAGLAEALSLGPTYGVSLALARRVRGLIWGAIGLLVLWHQVATRPSAAPAGAGSHAIAEAAYPAGGRT